MMITKNYIWLISMVLLMTAGGLWFARSSKAPAYKIINYKESKRMRIDKAFAQRFEATKDPATGEVPSDRLRLVYDYIQRLEAQGALRNGNLADAPWTERGPLDVGGRTRAILVDKNDPTRKTIFSAGVSGGLWKTTDITADPPEWTVVDDYFQNLNICAIAQDPNDPQVMYFGTGEGYFGSNSFRGQGIWKSTDGGNTWNHLASTNNGTFYFTIRLAIHPTTSHVYAATLGGLMQSKNGGQTWERVIGVGTTIVKNDMTSLQIAADGSMYVSMGHASGGGLVYKSAAGANVGDVGTWQRLTNFPTGRNRIELATAPSDANTIYAISTGAGSDIKVHKSINAGAGWSTYAGPTPIYNDQGWYDLVIGVAPNNANRVFAGVLTIALSEDGGLTWNTLQGGYHVDQHAITFDDLHPNNAYFGNDGGIYHCANASASAGQIRLNNRNEGYNVTQFYACAMHPGAYTDYFLAGSQDNGTERFEGYGKVRTTSAFGADGAYCHIDQLDPTYQIISWQNGNYLVSNNGGESFTGGVSVQGAYFINPSAYDSQSKNLYAIGNVGTGIFRYNVQLPTDTAWISFSNINTTSFNHISVSPNIPNRIYIGMNGGRMTVLNNAHTASSSVAAIITLPTSGTISCITEDENNAAHWLVTLSNYGVNSVWETFNSGANWTSVEGNLPDMPVNWVLFDPSDSDKALLATEVGVWVTENLNGTNTQWLPASNGMPYVRTDMLQHRTSDNLIIAGTHGRGLFSCDFRSPPLARFNVQQIGYLQASTVFENTSVNASSFVWNFGDGNTSTLRNPTNDYQNIGTYNVSLKVNDTLTTSKSVQILPDRALPYLPQSSQPYGGDFESLNEDFGVYTVSGSSWEKGNSTIGGKNGVKSGSNAWVTGLTEEWYQHETETYLYTPNYDFSEEGIYELSFWAKYDIQQGWDGFRVEYSLDRGTSWRGLGTAQTGWYNYSNGSTRTAFSPNSHYFTGTSAGFEKYTYLPQELIGKPNVAFRFAFKTNETGRLKGVAIDDFQINRYTENLATVLQSFEAAFSDDEEITVSWTTRPEYKCEGFDLEISENGKDFVFFSFTQGQGSAINTVNYIEEVQGMRKDLYFFRLKVKLTDGTFFYSDVVVVQRFEVPLAIQFLSPNPFTNFLDLTFNNIVSVETTFSLYDVSGRLVVQETLTLNSVYHRLELPVLARGIYVLAIQAGDVLLSRKVLKQ